MHGLGSGHPAASFPGTVGRGRPSPASGTEQGRAPQPLSSLQTVEALDSLLQVLVGSAGASGLLELQNILNVWLWQRLGFVGSLPRRKEGPTSGPLSAWCRQG